MKNLQYFIGKVCTIFTQPINRNFKEENPETFPEQPYFYFVGVVEAIDGQGIFITQVMSGLKSYFFLQNIVGIAEEEVLDPNDQKDAQIIDKMKSANVEARDKLKEYEKKDKEFVNIDEMTDMLKKAQQNNDLAK